MFADAPFRRDLHLSAVNSINWARIAAQIPYYVATRRWRWARRSGSVAFSVPTGNFGNVLAAWAARRMGLPMARLVVASNRNDILARFLATGNDMRMAAVEPSLSPSMDIQVSSNFERLLFELLDRDPAATAADDAGVPRTGRMDVPHAAWQRATTLMHGFRLDDAGTLAEIRRLDAECGYLADPHSAIGIAAARALPCSHHCPVIARPRPTRPSSPRRCSGPPAAARRCHRHLADLYDRPERYTAAPNDLAAIEAQVRAFALRNAA